MEKLATGKEIAEYLGVHPKTVDRWASQGGGPPFIRIEGARRYDWADIKAWVEEKKVRRG